MKHTEIPNEMSTMIINKSLEHGDKLVYASIRRYMNKDTRICYPAIGTICVKLKCSQTKIKNAINRLVAAGLINKIQDTGKKNSYYFPESEFDKKFEMFTDEFLDMDLDLNVKEFYIDIQQFLYGKETGIGKCSMSNAELSRVTGWSVPSIKKYKLILMSKNLLTEETTSKLDEAGLPVVLQSYNLSGLNQAALWVKAVTETVQKHDEDIEMMKARIAELERKLTIREQKNEFPF